MDLTETSALEQWRQAMEQQTSPSDVPATPPGPTQFTADQQPDTAALTRRVGASMQGATQPDSLDWKQWLGLGMEGFASGYAGRAPQGPGLLLRKQQQDQEAAQKQQLMQLEKINGLHKIVGKGGIMEGLQSLNLSEDQQKILVPQLRGFVKESTGVDFGDAYTQDLLSNKGAIEAFDAMMPEHGSLPDKTKLAIVKRINANPENAHKIVNDLHFQLGIKMAMEGKQVPDAVISQFDDKQKATIGDIAFKQILGTKNDASGNAKLKTSDLSNIPNADLMTDARINTLKDAGFTGLKSASTMEAESKARIERAQIGMSQVEAKAVLAKVTDPVTGKVDETKLFDTIKEMKTNPQGAESRIFDYFLKQNKGDEGKAISAFKGYLNSASASRSSGQVVGREQGYQSVINDRLDRISKETSATAQGRPLEVTDRSAIGAMRQTVRVAAQIKDEFSPEEISKYIGQFKRPIAQIKELARSDPKFDRLNTLIMTIKGTAFAEGGKQLTPFEAGITFGHIPTGDEFSAEQFLTKLNTTVEQTTSLIEDRINLATRPRGQGLPGQPGGKTLDATTVVKFLQQTGGDRNKARKLAKDAGYQIPSE